MLRISACRVDCAFEIGASADMDEVRNASARVLLADMTKLGIRGCTNATSFVAGVEVVGAFERDGLGRMRADKENDGRYYAVF